MIIEVFVTLFLVWFIWYFITTYIERKNMPAGPFPYPFLGNIPHIISADPVRPFSKLAEKYGDIFTVTFPNGNAVILNTASLAPTSQARAFYLRWAAAKTLVQAGHVTLLFTLHLGGGDG
jgi:hypothetical protein